MSSVVLLDIQKAFDAVDHQILLDKLRCHGISGDQLVFFASYLNNRQQCCNINGKLSSTKRIRCDVPQGSILGPLRFIIYMNDLPLAVKEAEITYADDTSLSKGFKTTNELKKQLIPAFSKVCGSYIPYFTSLCSQQHTLRMISKTTLLSSHLGNVYIPNSLDAS